MSAHVRAGSAGVSAAKIPARIGAGPQRGAQAAATPGPPGLLQALPDRAELRGDRGVPRVGRVHVEIERPVETVPLLDQ